MQDTRYATPVNGSFDTPTRVMTHRLATSALSDVKMLEDGISGLLSLAEVGGGTTTKPGHFHFTHVSFQKYYRASWNPGKS